MNCKHDFSDWDKEREVSICVKCRKRANDPDVDPVLGDPFYEAAAARDQEKYERQWAIEQRAAELFRKDYPSGNMPARLPQFRFSYPDPVGDIYRRMAEKELDEEKRKP